MVYVLFITFLAGYYFMWRSELISGIIIVWWYLLMWLSALFIWVTDAGMVLVLGFPVFIFGILLIIWQKSHNWKSKKKKHI